MLTNKLKKLILVFSVMALCASSTTVFAATNITEEYQSNVAAYENVAGSAMLGAEPMTLKGNALSDNERWIQETLQSIYAGDVVLYQNAAQVARLVQTGYSSVQPNGPYSITQGELVDIHTDAQIPVYIIAISGTDTKVENQSTNVWTDFLSGFERDNMYLRNIKRTMLATIPAGSNIVLAGHSLGGMVAQQVAADTQLKNTYNFLHTVTFGSPLIKGTEREGITNRLGDISDVVPYLSVSTLNNVSKQITGLYREYGGYFNIVKAHTESYQREDIWGKYDATGNKNGTKYLICRFNTTKFYFSPVVVTD